MHDLSFVEKLFGGPRTRAGWWAVGLLAGFVALFAVTGTWTLRLAAQQRAIRNFWDDPLYSVALLSTVACGIGAGVMSGIGLVARGERSLLLLVTLLVGAGVLLYSVGEFFLGM